MVHVTDGAEEEECDEEWTEHLPLEDKGEVCRRDTVLYYYLIPYLQDKGNISNVTLRCINL